MRRDGALAAAQAAGRDRVAFAFGLIVLGVAAYLAVGEVFSPQTQPGYDLVAYLAAAHRLLAGARLYDYDAGAFRLGPYGQFVYPPSTALAFVPLALLPLGLAVGIWLLILGTIAVVLGLALTRPLVPAQRPWALALFLFFQPVLWDLRLGNTALLTVALCWSSWRSRDRPARAGLLFAAALGVKLLPILLVPYFFAAGRLRMLLWTALAGLAVVALTLPVVGTAAWSDYLALIGVIAGSAPAAGSNVLPEVLGSGPGRVVIVVVSIALVLIAGLIGRMPRAETRSFVLALACVPLIATTIWYPYLSLALPLLVLVGLRDPLGAGTHRLRPSVSIGRILIWAVIGAQVIRQPDRDFIFPFVGLVALLGWAVFDLARETR